jgi:uncharacterized protein DUF3786
MARIDDYKAAIKLARAALSKDTFDDILDRSGLAMAGENSFLVEFIGNNYLVSYPDFMFSVANAKGATSEDDVPLQEQVLILHYMKSEKFNTSGKWVAYREIPGASFYFSAFVKRAIDPLKKAFGKDVFLLKDLAEKLGGIPIAFGDLSYEFHLFPKVPIQLVLWQGDEEFPSEANILFDASIEHVLLPEDIAWLSGMLVYRLMGMLRER